MKSSPSIWQLLHAVKLIVKILSIFVAILENTNFKWTLNSLAALWEKTTKKIKSTLVWLESLNLKFSTLSKGPSINYLVSVRGSPKDDLLYRSY